MILSLSLPSVGGPRVQSGTVHRVLAQPGAALRPGAPLLEVRVDLGAANSQDCPPVVFFRLLATERATLRTLAAAPGDVLAVGSPIGLATTTPDEGLEGPAARPLRTTSVTIQVDPLAG